MRMSIPKNRFISYAAGTEHPISSKKFKRPCPPILHSTYFWSTLFSFAWDRVICPCIYTSSWNVARLFSELGIGLYQCSPKCGLGISNALCTQAMWFWFCGILQVLRNLSTKHKINPGMKFVKHFPTLLYFRGAVPVSQHEGQHTLSSFRQWIAQVAMSTGSHAVSLSEKLEKVCCHRTRLNLYDAWGSLQW